MEIANSPAIKDSHGHGCGDEVAAAVGACLSDMLAAHAPGALACRWGGEEFIVAIPGAGDAGAGDTGATALTERLRAGLAETSQPHWPETLSLTGLLGIASGAAVAFYEIFQQADGAMYSAKAAGRNRVVCAREDCERSGDVVRAA